MRVVLDTNVVVSALLTPGGTAHQVLQLALQGDVQLCIDARIQAEYQEVLTRGQFRFAVRDVERLLEALWVHAQQVLAGLVPGQLPDEDDRMFIEVAVAAQADALVTGNLRHYRLAETLGIRVLAPGAFLRWWSRSGAS